MLGSNISPDQVPLKNPVDNDDQDILEQATTIYRVNFKTGAKTKYTKLHVNPSDPFNEIAFYVAFHEDFVYVWVTPILYNYGQQNIIRKAQGSFITKK